MAVLADTEVLQEGLYQEMRGRIQEADQSAPIRCPAGASDWLGLAGSS